MEDRKLVISTGASVTATYWNDEAMTWPEFCERLLMVREVNYTPEEYAALGNLEQKKVKDVGGYVFGELDETRQRKSEHLLTREGFTYDLDAITSAELAGIQQGLKNAGINYLVHSSMRHTPEKPRVRIIVPFEKALPIDRGSEQYKEKAKMFAGAVGIPTNDDQCSYEATHLFFWPSKLKDAAYLFTCETESDYLNLDALYAPSEPLGSVSFAEGEIIPTDDTYEYVIDAGTKEEAAQRISKGLATEIITAYANNDRENLKDRENYNVAKLVIVKTFLAGQIDRETAEACMIILAGDNEEWKQKNVDEFRQELRSGTMPTTAETFFSKFDYQGKYKPEPAPAPQAQDEKQDKQEKKKQALESFRKKRLHHTAEELDEISLPPIEFYIEGLLPTGVGNMAGAPKVGKSYLAMQMAYSVATGTDFLGLETVKAPVIYYSLEMAPNLIQDRMRQMYPYDEKPPDLHFFYEMPNITEGALEIMEADIKEYKAGLVQCNI